MKQEIRYIAAKDMLRKMTLPAEAAKFRRAAAKRAYEAEVDALTTALAVLDNTLASFYFPRIIYVGEAMLTQGRVHRRDTKALWQSFTGLTPQFRPALRLLCVSPDGSVPGTGPVEF